MHCSQAIFLARLLIGGPHQTPLGWSGAAVYPLIFNAAHHIGMLAIEILFHLGGIKNIVPHRQHDGPHRYFPRHRLLRQIDGVHWTHLGTESALGAGRPVYGKNPGYRLGKS